MIMATGYVYLDNDRNLNVRNKHYIDVENPFFWSENAHLIDTVWIFDTDNDDSMLKILNSFKRLELSTLAVNNFCHAIGFNLQDFLARIKPNK